MTHHKKALGHILVQNVTQSPFLIDDIINEFYDFILLYYGYLTALSILRLHSVDDTTIDEYEAVGRMIIGRGNRSTTSMIKPVPVSLCPQRIPHDLT
jgi:hypothetical protein